jgi:2-oxoisovalerate dehydrogenase E1 component
VTDFRLACISRAIDDREIALRAQNRAFFQISGAGHESLLLGFARDLRPGYDWFFPYYRDRALVLSLGVTPYEMLLQAVGSADDPASAGRQMPCHWGDRDRHIVTQSSATGTQCLPAVGCAEASRYIVRRDLLGCHAYGDELTYVSLGEGATSEGEFWESLNTACRLALPVLYVIADNGYAISVRSTDQAPAPISELVAGFRGLAVTTVDGCDYFAVRASARDTVARVRAGQGPALVHATVTRPYSHSLSDDQTKYRTGEELADEASRDPIKALEDELIGVHALTPEETRAIRDETRAEVADAANQALAARRPEPATVRRELFGPAPVVDLPDDPPVDETSEIVTFGEAIRRTLHEEMARDERIRVFGEDVADADEASLAQVPGKGGVFGITYGLQRAYGQARCFNTPLAEANLVGRSCGQGSRGLRPSPEIQFFDYIWPAMQQIKTELATIRWRSHGAFSCPTVLRVAIGGYLAGGSIWHSQCGESIFAHIPGIHIVMPSRARDAAGLLRTAFRCEDPVLFLEHKHLYRQGYARDRFPPQDWLLPFGRGAVVRPGSSVTVVTWGATVHRAVVAADAVDPSRTSVEVLDLRTIAPWDRDLIAESIAKTGRVLVLHEDTLTCGFGAEIAAWIADECFDDLEAPVLRLAARDVPVAYEPTLEDVILPQVGDIERHLAHLLSC